MSKQLLAVLHVIVILSACGPASHAPKTATTNRTAYASTNAPVTTTFYDVDSTAIITDSLAGVDSAISLLTLSRNDAGAYLLSPGFYEADFKTYCLQPGTPAPTVSDAYFQAPLTGSRTDIIETILRRSQNEPDLDQKNIQLLLWSVVSRSNFNTLSPRVQATGRRLLNPKQVFELQGGYVALAKSVVSVLPSSTGATTIKQLFEIGAQSYEAYEKLAVLNTPPQPRNTNITRNQWYRQQEGFYVRYLPTGYQQTKIQVYVPKHAAAMDTTASALLFDPVSLVVVAANSNAQRLGIGTAVGDVLRTVIRTIDGKKKRPTKPSATAKPQLPKT